MIILIGNETDIGNVFLMGNPCLWSRPFLGGNRDEEGYSFKGRGWKWGSNFYPHPVSLTSLTSHFTIESYNGGV